MVDDRESDRLYGLTHAEVELVRDEIARRYPGMDVEVREVDSDFRSRRPRPLYVLTSSVVRRVRKFAGLLAWRISEDERAVAETVAKVLETRDNEYAHPPRTPLFELCLKLEYGLVGSLLAPVNATRVVDLWFDGFIASQVELLASGVALAGSCAVGMGSDVGMEVDGPFEAKMSIREGLLERFEVRCGDSRWLDSRLILRSQQFEIEGYDVIVRADPDAWPLEISLRSAG